MKKRLAALLLLVWIAGIIAGCNSSPPVAKVNGEVITKSQMDKRVNLMLAQFKQAYGLNIDPEKDKDLMAEARKQAVNGLVEEKLQLKEADKRHIKANQEEVAKNLENVKTAMGGDTGYQAFLKETKLTDKDIKALLENQSRIDQLREQVTRNVKVSTAEAQAYFKNHASQYDTPREVRVSHILVKTEKEANDIIAQLKKGADFATLAKSKSTDTASAKNGGDLGWIKQTDSYVPEFLTAAMALKTGQITEKPVKTQYGYHIIKCFGEHPEQKATYEKVAVQVQKDALADKKDKTYSTFIQNLKKKAKISIYQKNFTAGEKTSDSKKKQ